jgi:4-cresol dehydrogenase (hydroxylating)
MSITEPLPAAIDAAVEAFIAALGDDAVVTDPEAVREFRDPFAYRGSDAWDASAVVMPTTTDEVQAVVRIANEHDVPLWTFSQGRNITYGGPAPRVRGSVLVNLRRMNRVLEVNEELAYAVVEPGVRWFDLYDALEEAGGRLWTSIPDLGWGSVIANCTEYGRGYTPFGDHAENVCGMEVVLPDGEILRTGMGAMSNSAVTHVYKHSYGPQLQGLFHQSGLGIVTRMGFWLQLRPETYASCFLTFEGDDTLEAVVDGMRELMLEGVVTNYPVLLGGVRLDESGQPQIEPGSDHWLARYALYGREQMVEAAYAACESVFAEIPGVQMRKRVYRGDDRSIDNHEDRVMAGVPDLDLLELFKIPYGEDTAHLDFSPVAPLSGPDVAKTAKLMRSLYQQAGQAFMSGLLMSPRNVIHISTTFFDPHDEEQTTAVYDNYTSMVEVMSKLGYPIYRTNLQHMDLIAGQLDFNDHALTRLNERIKDVMDPNGILQPGKSGIWHRRYRAQV